MLYYFAYTSVCKAFLHTQGYTSSVNANDLHVMKWSGQFFYASILIVTLSTFANLHFAVNILVINTYFCIYFPNICCLYAKIFSDTERTKEEPKWARTMHCFIVIWKYLAMFEKKCLVTWHLVSSYLKGAALEVVTSCVLCVEACPAPFSCLKTFKQCACVFAYDTSCVTCIGCQQHMGAASEVVMSCVPLWWGLPHPPEVFKRRCLSYL